MYCLRCHYDLGHLSGRVCPECGKAFDPDNPNSVFTERPMSAGEEARALLQRLAELGAVTGGLWLGAFVLLLFLELCHAAPILTQYRGDIAAAPMHDRIVSAIYLGLLVLPCILPLTMIVLTAWVWPRMPDSQ